MCLCKAKVSFAKVVEMENHNDKNHYLDHIDYDNLDEAELQKIIAIGNCDSMAYD